MTKPLGASQAVTRKTDQDTEGYGLQLGDGSRWCFFADEPKLARWLKEFAEILCLNPTLKRGRCRAVFRDIGQLSASELRLWLKRATLSKGRRGEFRYWLWGKRRRFACLARRAGNGSRWECVVYVPVVRQRQARIHLMNDALGAVYLQVILDGGMPLHAALAEFRGQGVLFAAAGGTGKSTSMSRLPPPWKPRCDDTVLVVRARGGIYRVHPFPTWSDHLWGRTDSRWPAEDHLPVSAIFFLQQAPRDSVERLGAGLAALHIQESAAQIMARWQRQWLPEQRKRLGTARFENACAMARRIPVFMLKLSLNGQFWRLVEKALADLPPQRSVK
ncbi:MAG: SynChlorMet cassette protein ScmC [Verrucomicrobiae bacterium]|nr:SynChlorMet cassette protein ScmC [Verrucomicrobiae bacterium]